MKSFLCLFLLCPALCFGQTKIYPFYIVKLSPTAILPFPAIQPSVEYRLNKRWSVQAEAGVGVSPFRDTAFVQPLGLKANMEWRCYIGKKRRPYAALNLFYRYERTHTSITYLPSYDTSIILRDAFSATKNVYGAAIIYGVQLIKHSFVADFYVGAGVMYRKSINRNIEYMPSRGDVYQYGSADINMYQQLSNSFLEEGSGFNGHFTIGVRLGYKFKKKTKVSLKHDL